MAKGWQFPLNNDGSAQGFSDGAIDTFSGKRLSSLIREVIQNSLDAVDESKQEPVTVEFALNYVEKKSLEDLLELKAHLSECAKQAKRQNVPVAEDFFQNAVKCIDKKDKVPILTISDSNTTGLTGPTNDDYGAWFALIKGTGITQKSSSGSLGSFGHGSKATFAMGTLRTVYYLTNTVNPLGKLERRFQGKSILQSHRHPHEKKTTQAIGFFGENAGLKPLLNKEVPSWALELRELHSSDLGTTIFIPYPRFRDDLFPETIITVVANFFYAIQKKNLRVIVNGEVIDHSNVIDRFDWCTKNIENERDEIDYQHAQDCFKTIETIINPTHQNSQEIPHFGRIDWYLRLGEDFNYKAVAISRESGMLITRKPKKLEVFRNKKPFDMFVFVESGKGSQSLKRLENPAHDNFEFDRVQDASDEKSIKDHYDRLTKKVKEILDRYASIDTSDEVQVTEMTQLMAELGSTEGQKGGFERGTHMTIARGQTPRKRSAISGSTGATGLRTDIGSNDLSGTGQGTKRTRTTGTTVGNGTKEVTTVGGEENVVQGATKSQVERLRSVRIKGTGNENKVRIMYTVHQAGLFNFKLYKSGETEPTEIILLKDGNKVSNYSINLEEAGRKSMIVEVADPGDLDFALEGWIDVQE